MHGPLGVGRADRGTVGVSIAQTGGLRSGDRRVGATAISSAATIAAHRSVAAVVVVVVGSATTTAAAAAAASRRFSGAGASASAGDVRLLRIRRAHDAA